MHRRPGRHSTLQSESRYLCPPLSHSLAHPLRSPCSYTPRTSDGKTSAACASDARQSHVCYFGNRAGAGPRGGHAAAAAQAKPAAAAAQAKPAAAAAATAVGGEAQPREEHVLRAGDKRKGGEQRCMCEERNMQTQA